MPNAADIIKDYVSEFSRLQNWMLSIKGKDDATYDSMHDRYMELKVTLSSLGVLEFPQFCPQNRRLAMRIIHNFQKTPKI